MEQDGGVEQVFAVRGRDVVGAGPPSNRDRDVPGVGDIQRGGGRADPAAVFAQRHVADVGARVFDSPMVPPERQQLLGREPAGGDSGELLTQHATGPMIPDVYRMLGCGVLAEPKPLAPFGARGIS